MAKRGELSHLAVPGATFAVRVTPGAARNEISETDGGLAIRTTEVAEGGRATNAAAAVLARALGVGKTRLTLLRGARSRDKVFRLD